MASLKEKPVDSPIRRFPAVTAVANVLLVSAWLWLSGPTLGWLGRRLADPSNRTSGILLAAALLILLARACGRFDLGATIHGAPSGRLVPLVLLVLCAFGQFLKVRLFDSNLLAAMGLVVGSHSLAGLYVSAQRWRRGWVFVLFAMALLPLGPHLDAFVGFPARIATARLVEQVLRACSVPVQSAEAILILENGVANIDLPCSGVKGFWVGGIFFLALTLLERRALGLRWLLAGLAFVSSLALANFLRVLCLVVTDLALGRPALANLIHLPLGVFGFVISCALAIVLIRRLVEPDPGRPEPAVARAGGPAIGLTGLLALMFALLSIARSSERSAVATIHPVEIRFPVNWVITPLALDEKETRLFEHNAAHQVGKWRFRAGEQQGTLLVAVADSFRSHHAPEVCLEGSGHRVDDIRRAFLAPDVPIKLIDIEHHRASAATWFQSSTATTDSLMDRMLAEFLAGDRRWALVSVLFDVRSSLDESTSALLRRLHAAVAVSLAVSINRKGS